MRADLHLRIGLLYPDLLNIYADRGNVMFLQRRCADRGIGVSIASFGLGRTFDPEHIDLIYIGGGQDRDQALCAEDLRTVKLGALQRFTDADRPLLAVCGGYQLLGRFYESNGERLIGTGLGGFETRAADGPRLIGPCAIRTQLGGPTDGVLAGFENHAGRTKLDTEDSALGRVLSGHGNDGSTGNEGFRQGNVIGTYLHGPLLPKNWWLADWLIARSLGIEPEQLHRLDDGRERAAHIEALLACGIKA